MTTANNGVSTPEEYIASLPDTRREILAAMRKTINDNLPQGFREGIAYGMLSWAVPHSLYPPGYHCDPKLPLGFMGIASQKNHIALYSMCIYSSNKLLEWFQREWPKHSSKKLNMGKSCIRFAKPEDVPLKLIGQLASRVTPQQWIQIYEKALKR
jgi:Domain of unknown function (DU1801)